MIRCIVRAIAFLCSLGTLRVFGGAVGIHRHTPPSPPTALLVVNLPNAKKKRFRLSSLLRRLQDIGGGGEPLF